MKFWFHRTATENPPTHGSLEVYGALEQFLNRGKTLPISVSFGDASEDSIQPDPGDLGLLVWLDGAHDLFLNSITDLYFKGLRRFALFIPIDDIDRFWHGLPLPFRVGLKAGVPKLNGLATGDRDTFLASCNSESKPNPRLELAAMARLLQREIRAFAHNSKWDISNRFLAPARLLLQSGDASKTNILLNGLVTSDAATTVGEVWSQFQKDIANDYGSLGEELRETSKPITTWINDGVCPNETDCWTLMELLTTIREQAGDSTSHDAISSSTEPVEPVNSPVGRGFAPSFRVLVVDDHATAWRPVFAQLAVECGEISFEFSPDGETFGIIGSATKPTATAVCFGFYDLVILDVFLGAKDGRKILAKIRRDFSQLPVLLWTTSRDEEIAVDATLANMIVLKKTVTWNAFKDSIMKWAAWGKAMRKRTLPNPFFNHAISDLDLRKLAVDCHEWCLKQLDSFHALDNEFFRYFTDHGGRHIVKLWELMEQVLQPFLIDDNEALLAVDPENREREILGLYLAVVFHELGMFPMRMNGVVEDFSCASKDYLKDVRKLHALRGMLLLADTKSPGYWNDATGALLAGRLRDANMAVPLAILVGYHSRMFSLSRDGFLVLDGCNQKATNRINKLKSKVFRKAHSPYAFKRMLSATCNARAENRKDMERLRKQCAIFRFVDALDITKTRNFADFLIGTAALPAVQYRENLKREVCPTASAERGEVRVGVIPKPPDKATIVTILKFLRRSQTFPDVPSEFDRVWNPPKNGWTEPAIDEHPVKRLQKVLDSWLEKVWDLLIHRKGASLIIKHLQDDLAAVTCSGRKFVLTEQGASIVGSITALSVAGELLDEYKAIVEGGMQDRIKLAEFRWDCTENWEDDWKRMATLKKVSELQS